MNLSSICFFHYQINRLSINKSNKNIIEIKNPQKQTKYNFSVLQKFKCYIITVISNDYSSCSILIPLHETSFVSNIIYSRNAIPIMVRINIVEEQMELFGDISAITAITISEFLL